MTSKQDESGDSRPTFLDNDQQKFQWTGNDSSCPPPYDVAVKPSAPPEEHKLPEHFDISTIPDSAILYNDGSLNLTQTSRANIERSTKGVVSFDPFIEQNPDELWLYFTTYLKEKPRFYINVRGFRIECVPVSNTINENSGENRPRTQPETREVTEFSFKIDITQYVNDQWWRIAVVPTNNNGANPQSTTVRTLMEQYAQTEKTMKFIALKKQVHGWNLGLLRQHIWHIVRSTGYMNQIEIKIEITNNVIEAQSSSKLNRFAESTAVRVLCVLSCLWLIFGPIYCCMKSSGAARDELVADYALNRPIERFLQLNASVISEAAFSRSHNTHVAFID